MNAGILFDQFLHYHHGHIREIPIGLNPIVLGQGDFTTPEQTIPSTGIPGVDWEVCMTMNTTWGFSEHDHAWKSDETLIRNLVDIVSKGGNYLLNIGPKGDGSVPEESMRSMRSIGRWMAAGNGYLAVVSPNCRTVFVSNISTFLDDPKVILQFTEQPGSLTPFDIGDIVGIHLAPVLDAGTAMGALLIFGSRGRVFAYDLTIPRDQWGTTTGFGRIVAEGLFLASNDSVQAVGEFNTEVAK